MAFCMGLWKMKTTMVSIKVSAMFAFMYTTHCALCIQAYNETDKGQATCIAYEMNQ